MKYAIAAVWDTFHITPGNSKLEKLVLWALVFLGVFAYLGAVGVVFIGVVRIETAEQREIWIAMKGVARWMQIGAAVLFARVQAKAETRRKLEAA